jgi:hypothetical protein
MYDHQSYFPTFGNHHDLYISSSGGVSCNMNGAFYARSYGLNNFELCSNSGKELEEMEVWYLKKQPTVELMLAEYSIDGAHVGRSSNVASAQEVMSVSMIAGYPPRADLWKMCYNVSADTKTSQTFHAKCDNVGSDGISLSHSLTHSLAPLTEDTSFGRSPPPTQHGFHLPRCGHPTKPINVFYSCATLLADGPDPDPHQPGEREAARRLRPTFVGWEQEKLHERGQERSVQLQREAIPDI